MQDAAPPFTPPTGNAPPPESPSQKIKGHRVLIVDDDASMRLIANRILTQAGARVVEAKSVREGLELFLKQPFDIVLLDLNMPDEDGYTFLENRNILERLRLVPVIVCSGRKDAESVTKAISLGARGFIIKPFYAQALIDKLNKYLPQ